MKRSRDRGVEHPDAVEPLGANEPDAEGEEIRVDDRRHWACADEAEVAEAPTAGAAVRQPSVIDEYRQRTEEAEAKLQEYIAAFKSHQQEQDAFRGRLTADIERKVELEFGGLLAELLETVDDLNLALEHVRDVAVAESLARGVTMARDRFLGVLARHGVETISPDGEEFDPNDSEAMRMDPVDSKSLDGKVTATLRPGYRLGARVIRPAQVAVGRYVPGS